MNNNKIFLYTGLTLLAASFIAKWSGLSLMIFWGLLIAAIFLKSIFLINIIRGRKTYSKTGLYLIISGVIIILISLIFKYYYPLPILRNILFYGALMLKFSGVVILIVSKRKRKKV